MLTFSFLEILYLFGAFHGIFLASLLILRKKTPRSNIYLALLIFLFSFYLTENVIYSSGYLREVPQFFLASLPLLYLIGPLYYAYIRKNVQPDSKWRPIDLLHFVPFLFELVILIPFYSLDSEIKARIYDATRNTVQPFQFNIYFFAYLVYIGCTFWYFFKSFQLLSKVEMTGHSKAAMKSRWLKRMSIVFFSYIAVSLLTSFLPIILPGSAPFLFNGNLIIQTGLIHAIGYVAFLFPELFMETDSNGKKYQFSAIDSAVISELKIKILELLEKNQPYTEHNISPEYFSEKLHISRHDLSQILSEGMQTNFYDLINSYRVEKAKKLLLSPEYEDAKILHVAFDSGFSNKSSFLRNFKKHTGITPSEYRASHEPVRQ